MNWTAFVDWISLFCALAVLSAPFFALKVFLGTKGKDPKVLKLVTIGNVICLAIYCYFAALQNAEKSRHWLSSTS